MKIWCFIWLALVNKILTWDNLQKRGSIGPGICALCGLGEDSVQHLFYSCYVWKSVFECLSEQYHLQPLYKSDNLISFLGTWIVRYSRHSECCYLPFLVICVIWKERNHCIFEGKNPSTLGIFHQIDYYFQLHPASSLKIKNPRICGLDPTLVFPYRFFDGEGANYKGRVGFCLVLN